MNTANTVFVISVDWSYLICKQSTYRLFSPTPPHPETREAQHRHSLFFFFMAYSYSHTRSTPKSRAPVRVCASSGIRSSINASSFCVPCLPAQFQRGKQVAQSCSPSKIMRSMIPSTKACSASVSSPCFSAMLRHACGFLRS